MFVNLREKVHRGLVLSSMSSHLCCLVPTLWTVYCTNWHQLCVSESEHYLHYCNYLVNRSKKAFAEICIS